MTLRSILSSSALLAVALITLSGCTDAGRCALGSPGCFCDDQTCQSGTCVDGMCPPAEGICEESCFASWSGDGTCDDGGEGARYSICNLGSDCIDCGARANPCENPDFPVFCPATPDFPSQCWSANVDCSSITFCAAAPSDPHACATGFRYDCTAETCVANPCTDPARPTFCPYQELCNTDATNCCFSPNADCRTAGECHGSWYVCRGRLASGPLVLSCGTMASEISCVLPATGE
jgi:hypothetical protein